MTFDILMTALDPLRTSHGSAGMGLVTHVGHACTVLISAAPPGLATRAQACYAECALAVQLVGQDHRHVVCVYLLLALAGTTVVCTRQH
jgi:hypothetical protein